MDVRELIDGTDERGRIGFRGAFSPLHSLTKSEITVTKALELNLIQLITAWRSTENNPHRDAGPVDRRVYGLTDSGWAYKITGGTDHLQNYLVSVMADAEAAHWGVTDAEVTGLRFPESSFDEWENPVLYASNVDPEPRVYPYGPMDLTSKLYVDNSPDWKHPKTTVYPHKPPLWDAPRYVAKGADVLRQERASRLVANDTVVDTPYPGREVAKGRVDEAHWPTQTPKGLTEWAVVFTLLAALAGLGWWLS